MSTELEGKTVETVRDLQAAFPDLCKEISAQAYNDGHSKGMEEGIKVGVDSGAKAGMDRIKAIEEHAKGFPGHDKLVNEMKFDGKTTAEEAAVKILGAERDLKTRTNAQFHNDAPAPVPGAHSVDEFSETTAQTRDRLIEEQRVANGGDYKKACMSVAKDHPELFDVAHR